MTPEQAKELKQTILWTEFCKEVDLKINYYIQQLTTCEPEELCAIQKQISSLQVVKQIPDDVLDPR